MVNVINQFSGWMSQDDQFIGKGQYIYSHGFDVTRSPWEFKPMPPIEEEFDNGIYPGNYKITSIFPDAFETGGVWVWTEDWKVKDSTGTTVADVGTFTPVIDAILFLGVYYVFTADSIYPYTPSGGSLTPLTPIVPSVGSFYTHPVIYQGGEMYFPNNYNVFYIDSTGVLQTLFTTDFSRRVRGVSIQGSNLRVYTEFLVSIVDIGTKTVSYSQVLPFSINGVKSDGLVDYVITDTDEMYICSWLEYRKICESERSDTLANYTAYNTKFTFKTHRDATTLSIANDRVYTIDNNAPRFLIYGKKMEWLTSAFSYWPVHTDIGWNITNFTAILCFNNTIYVGYTFAGNNRFGSIDLTSTDTCYESVLITAENDFWDFSLEKQLNEIRVGKEWTTATLWASIDGATFEQIDTLDQTEIENKTIDYKPVFRKLALMFKLNSSTDKIINADVRFTKNQV